jgi:hypothetical protein
MTPRASTARAFKSIPLVVFKEANVFSPTVLSMLVNNTSVTLLTDLAFSTSLKVAHLLTFVPTSHVIR